MESNAEFENIDRILNKAVHRWGSDHVEKAKKQYAKLTQAAKEYAKRGGIPGGFGDSHRCQHLFKDLLEVINEGKNRYDRAHEEFQTLVYFYSCMHKNIDLPSPSEDEDYQHTLHHGIDKLLDWAHDENMDNASKAEKEVVHLREMQIQWDKFVKATPILGKLPPVDKQVVNTVEIDAVIQKASKVKGLKTEVDAAKRELENLRHKSNQYTSTVVGLPNHEDITETASPEPRRRKTPERKEKEPDRKGFQGSLKRKVVERQVSREQAEGDTILLTKDRMRRMEQREEMYKQQIEELTTRLSSIASKQLTEGNPNIADLSDRNRPTKIAEKFGELYDEEWSEAYEDLSNVMKYDEDKILQTLCTIVMKAFEFCHDMSETQVKDIENKMEKCMTLVTCVCNNEKYTVERNEVDPNYYSSVNKLAREWRKSAALASVTSLCVIFKEHKMKECEEFKGWDLKKLKDIDIYIDKCIKLTWLMVVQQPKMHLAIVNPGEKVDKMTYRFYHQKGSVVKMTVWPALYLCENGALVSKGFVYPE